MTKKFDGLKVLNVPMQPNDSGATTVRGYLKTLLFTLWNEGEGFSGKRPFGNSGWEIELAHALVKEKIINGSLIEEDGEVYVGTYRAKELYTAIFAAIEAL